VLRDLGDAAVDDIVTRWADAWQAGRRRRDRRDARRRRALLDAAAARVVPRQGRDPRLPARGPAAIALAVPAHHGQRPARVRHYLWDDAAGAYVPGGLDVLTLRDGCVAEIVAFLTADLTRFGLAARIRP
jgi:RNA polymerase sigma-70 factor (ECF subfamily)